MKKAVIISCLWLVLGGAALTYLIGSGFTFWSRTGEKIEDLDALVARVSEAAKAEHFAAGLETQTCQARHIGDLVVDVLDGKPALVCDRSLEPAAPLGKPLAIVDLDSKRLDAITRDLPPALISPSPSAASTIVFTHCSKSEVGRYGYIFPHAAYRQDCSLVFVGQNSASEMQILGVMSFWSLPPRKIDPRFTFGDVVADRPESQMQDYIVYRSADAAKVLSR